MYTVKSGLPVRYELVYEMCSMVIDNVGGCFLV
jgi:hypothetical protein